MSVINSCLAMGKAAERSRSGKNNWLPLNKERQKHNVALKKTFRPTFRISQKLNPLKWMGADKMSETKHKRRQDKKEAQAADAVEAEAVEEDDKEAKEIVEAKKQNKPQAAAAAAAAEHGRACSICKQRILELRQDSVELPQVCNRNDACKAIRNAFQKAADAQKAAEDMMEKAVKDADARRAAKGSKGQPRAA